MAPMSADAVAVFRPKRPERLKPFLDLDDESEESEGLYAEPLADGAMLVHTFQPFELFRDDPRAISEWLAQFGDALPDVHDDPRGLFFFPDSTEPNATTYEGVLDEVAQAGEGLFFPTDSEGAEQLADLAHAAEAAGIDMNALQGMAAQLLGGASGGSSFEMGKLITDLNEKLLGALGASGGNEPERVETNPGTKKSPDEK